MKNVGHTTALATELSAIRNDLTIVENLHFHNVIVETNCQVTFYLLLGLPNPFHPHSTSIMDCKNPLPIILHTQLKHVMSDSDMAADTIAKKEVYAPLSFYILYDCPPKVDLLCLADYAGLCDPEH
ncbi:hypothetical protein SLA2020_528620 [Shorea laevis]